MIYTTLTGVRNTPTPAPFDMPIIGHQELYNRLEVPTGAAVLIKSGSTDGYADTTSLMQPICTFLDFNPYKIKPFMINNAGKTYSDGFIPDIINGFMGEMEDDNINGGFFYPDLTGTDYGAIFYEPSYSNDQAGIGGTIYSGGYYLPFRNVMYNFIKYQANDGVQYRFEIWPETVFQRGYIDPQHFQRDGSLIRSGQVLLNIWKANERYYFEIYLISFDYAQVWTDAIDSLNGAEVNHIYNPANPLDNTPTNGDEGGNGDFDNDNDNVGIPDLPSLDITALGGFNLYKLQPTAFAQLMQFLNTTEPGASILKWFTNPIQAIAAAYILPYPVKGTSPATVSLLGLPTTISCAKCSPWNEWNLGTVYIKQGFGDCFLDYSPYTRVSMYLPFIGVRQLTADDIIGHNINVTYQFDNISGACIAYISSDNNVRYTFSGSCAVGIPISQSNWGQTYIAAATAAAGAISGGISAGLSASGKGGGAIIGATVKGAVEGSGGLDAFNAKPTVSRSGSICGASSALGVEKPYLIIEKPDKAKISDPKSIIGITSGRVLSLGGLSGFNALENFHLHGITATAEELDEIETLLHEGVIF